MERRKFTVEQKLAILKEAETEGVTPTLRKHGIYAKMIYRWKEQLAIGGKEALSTPYRRTDPELRRLQLENQRLKNLIAEKELALQIKEELLKKTSPPKKTR